MAGETSNLADVIVASGAVAGELDDAALWEAVNKRERQQAVSTELVRGRKAGKSLHFSLYPNSGATEKVFARHLKQDDYVFAETEEIEQRLVTPEEPFEAQRCAFDLDFKEFEGIPTNLQDGQLVFQGDFGYLPDYERDVNLIQYWAVSVALSRLSEFDITETQDGLTVVEWAEGAFVNPGVEVPLNQ